MTFGYRRDDAGVFLPEYLNKEIVERDPFQGLDQGGVGKLVDMAAKLGRGARPGIKCGICGEHGGDPASVEFSHNVGLDYVSCSPPRPDRPPGRSASRDQGERQKQGLLAEVIVPSEG